MVNARPDFPVTEDKLRSPVTGETMPLVYLDHAASTHAPTPVLAAHERFIREAYANVHRGAHHLSIVSTEAFEDVRWKVKAFLRARDDHDVVFTENTTAALDLAAHLFSQRSGPTLVTMLEHHSNDLPHRARGPVVHVDADPSGRLDMDDLERKLRSHQPKLVALTVAANVTGILTPVQRVTQLAHSHGVPVLLDAAQGLAHLPMDIRAMDVDLLAAAGHKAYAPMGAAFLVAPKPLIDEARPYRPGGGTVKLVGTDEVVWTSGVERHEGGTPNVPGIVAMGAALDYLRAHGLENVRTHELALLRRMVRGLQGIDGVHLLGDPTPEGRVGVASFTVDGVPHGLVSTALDLEFGVATRNGCFCAHPYILHLLGVDAEPYRQRLRQGGSTRDPDFPGAVRASIGIYNNDDDVQRFLDGVKAVAAGETRGDYAFHNGSWVPRHVAAGVDPRSLMTGAMMGETETGG